jgi:hypothetical protein
MFSIYLRSSEPKPNVGDVINHKNMTLKVLSVKDPMYYNLNGSKLYKVSVKLAIMS